MRQVLRWGLLLALGACIEPASAPPDPVPVALLTPEVWSGGEAVLNSAAFAPERGLPVVLLNDDTLAVHRLDDTTVAAQLPDLPGTQALRVLAADVLDLPIAIELRGFESATWGPLMNERLQPLPGWPPSVVGSGVTGAAVWNLHATMATPLPDSLHDPACSRGVGPSYATSGVSLVASCDVTSGLWRWWSWRVHPALELVEDTLCGGSDRFVAALSPGVSASVAHHDVIVSVRDGSTCSGQPFIRAEETYDIAISPRGDRAVILAGNYSPLDGSPSLGVPVLDVPTGRLAYGVAPILRSPTAAFSAEGDTLFLAGLDEADRYLLLVLRAGDGLVLRSVALPFKASAIAPDASRPWLYVVGEDFSARQGRLLVFDRDSLGLRASLDVPDTIPGGLCCDHTARIVPSPPEQRVYVVNVSGFFGSNSSAFLTRFRTPP